MLFISFIPQSPKKGDLNSSGILKSIDVEKTKIVSSTLTLYNEAGK